MDYVNSRICSEQKALQEDLRATLQPYVQVGREAFLALQEGRIDMTEAKLTLDAMSIGRT
jgi:hypothetical protein